MALKGIDVSAWQGVIDWEKVKAAGVQFAIIRCGIGQDYQSQDDKQFFRNVKECERLGMPWGTYLFSYSNGIEKTKGETNHVLRLIDAAKKECGGELRWFKYPVFLDIEPNGITEKCSPKLLGDMAEYFCGKIRDAGYIAGVYADKARFTKLLTDARFDNFPRWCAQYYNSCTLQKPFVGWQKSSKGKVDGINGYVDMNEFYVDYSAEKTVEQPVPAEPVEESKLPDLSGYVGTSIAGALNAIGYPSSYESRKELAFKLGIVGYKGTAQQNLDMIAKLGGKVQEEPKQEKKTYKVKSGDNLTAIAKKYKTTVDEIVQINHIPDKNLIYVGQEITIP